MFGPRISCWRLYVASALGIDGIWPSAFNLNMVAVFYDTANFFSLTASRTMSEGHTQVYPATNVVIISTFAIDNCFWIKPCVLGPLHVRKGRVSIRLRVEKIHCKLTFLWFAPSTAKGSSQPLEQRIKLLPVLAARIEITKRSCWRNQCWVLNTSDIVIASVQV
jgi:hypothetical protein